eukprot:g5851.t1
MSSEIGRWTTELFLCTEDSDVCCRVFWTPCCVYAQQGQLIFEPNKTRYWTDVCVYCLFYLFRCQWALGTVRREDIRIKYNIPARPSDDLIAHCFCHPCATCQESRTLKSLSEHRSVFASQPDSQSGDPNHPAVMFERHADYVMSRGVRKPTNTQVAN